MATSQPGRSESFKFQPHLENAQFCNMVRTNISCDTFPGQECGVLHGAMHTEHTRAEDEQCLPIAAPSQVGADTLHPRLGATQRRGVGLEKVKRLPLLPAGQAVRHERT